LCILDAFGLSFYIKKTRANLSTTDIFCIFLINPHFMLIMVINDHKKSAMCMKQKQIEALKDLCLKAGITDADIAACAPQCELIYD